MRYNYKLLLTLMISFISTFFSLGQNTGDIAFIAFNADGNDDTAIVALADLPANTIIYFTDNESNGSGGLVDTNEGILQWDTGGAVITAGTVVTFTDLGSSRIASVGTLTVALGTMNLAASGDALFAYLGSNATTPTTFLAGIQNEAGNFGDLTGSGLTEGSTFVNFFASGNPDGGKYNGPRTGQGSFSNYLALIADTNNWSINSSNGEALLPYDTTSFKVSPTWTGATNNSWTTATNWSTGSVPTASDNIIIPNTGVNHYPTITSSVTANSITINSGASLIANAAVTGNVTYKRTLTANWHLVSSPVNGESVQNLTSVHSFPTQSGSTITLAPYNNNGTAWNYYTNSTNANITPGSGLSAKLGAVSDLSFTGTINTGNISYSIAPGTANNFNLVGNPFTSYINLGTFFTDNNGKFSEATIWMWNQATNSYDLKMSGTHGSFQIAPGQGFFVSAGSNTNINFNTANQSHQTDTFQKSARNEVTLTVRNEKGKSKSTTIFFIDGTTKGFDNGFDGTMFGSANRFSLYSQLVSDNQGKNYAIQSLPINEMEKTTIPIGIRAYAGQEIEFSASSKNLQSDMKIYLEDRANNKFIDITDSTYKITPKNDINGIGQFYLRASRHNLDAPLASSIDDVSVYKSASNTLNIVGLQSKNATINIYSLIGKKVSQKQFTSNGFSSIEIPSLTTGVYIIELTSELGKTSKKIILE